MLHFFTTSKSSWILISMVALILLKKDFVVDVPRDFNQLIITIRKCFISIFHWISGTLVSVSRFSQFSVIGFPFEKRRTRNGELRPENRIPLKIYNIVQAFNITFICMTALYRMVNDSKSKLNCKLKGCFTYPVPTHIYMVVYNATFESKLTRKFISKLMQF